MQDQNLAMLQPDLPQGPMDCCGVFFGKRRFVSFLKVLKIGRLGLFPGYIAADAIHGDTMGVRVQPRPERAGVLQLSNTAKGPNPYVLKHIEPTVWIARQTCRLVEQWPLHDRDQVFEGAHFAGLATKRQPLV